MIKIPELLMPAGGPEQLRAAVANGADAVYMSGSMFTARANARNFTDQEIADAIEFAHLHGVKIHITQNTLIKNDEIEDALRHAVRMYELGADALILQDRGLAALIKKVLPDMPLHLSTQGTAYDASGVLSAAEAGFSRVILSRELSLDEIREVKKNSPVEIETFVHGAICICYSGQCHLSDYIGGRSGNRGACAQPCRLPYELCRESESFEGKNGKIKAGSSGSERFPLSPSDMNLVSHLRELALTGVDSIKIEGRMKSPEYVATVASIYRKYLDMINDGLEDSQNPAVKADKTETTTDTIDPVDIIRLKQMFNRGDFTDAYLMGKSDQSLMSEDIPKHKGVKIGKVISVDKKRGHVNVRLSGELANGDGIEIRSGGEACGNVITYIKEYTAPKRPEKKNESKQKGRAAAGHKKNVQGGQIIKSASAGMTVTAGDIPALGSSVSDFVGADVYKITDKKLMKEAAESYNKVPQRIDTEFVFSASSDNFGNLTASVKEGGKSFYATVSSQQPFERAINRPADEESVKQRLSKTGGTPYRVTDCHVELSGGPVISAAELNNMRRNVLEDITQQRLAAGKPEASAVSAARSRIKKLMAELEGVRSGSSYSGDKKQVIMYFYERYDCRDRVISFADHFRTGIPDSIELLMLIPVRLADDQTFSYILSSGSKARVYMPAITKDWSEEKMADLASKLEKYCVSGELDGVYAANHSHVHFLKKYDIPLFYDEGMNIYNVATLNEGVSEGMCAGVVSHELSQEELSEFADVSHICEITVGGRIPLMYMEHCPIGSGLWSDTSKKGGQKNTAISSSTPCTADKKRHYCRTGDFTLIDRKGEKFPIFADDSCCRTTLISHRALEPESFIRTIDSRFKKFRIYVYDEQPADIDLNVFMNR